MVQDQQGQDMDSSTYKKLKKGKRYKFVCYSKDYVVVVVPRINKPWVSQSPAIMVKNRFEFKSQHNPSRGWVHTEIDYEEFEAAFNEILDEIFLFPEMGVLSIKGD